MSTATYPQTQSVLAWRRATALMDHFVLVADGEVLAMLKVLGRSQPIAELEAPERRLVFWTSGLSPLSIRVYHAGRENERRPVLSYDPDLRGTGGSFRLGDGGQLRWQRRRRGSHWARRLRAHRRRSAWTDNSRSSAARHRDHLRSSCHVLVNRTGNPLIVFGEDGTVRCFLWDAMTPSSSTELLAVLALGWLLTAFDDDWM